MRITSKLLRSTIVGALGGFLFGFDTVVISGTNESLTRVFNLSAGRLGLTVSIALIGTIIGCFVAGQLGQKIGGRNALRVMAILYTISAIGCALAGNWSMLMVFRFIGGLGIGGSSVLGPVYIAELAPASWRGRLVGTFQINIVIGILVAYVSNWYIAGLNLGATEWRWQLGVACFPAILFLILLYTIPQSSRFLISQDSHEDAIAVLRDMGSDDPTAEMQSIRDAIKLEAMERSASVFHSSLKLPLFLAISIGFFNQLSGINAILYYANAIFGYAGMDRMSGFSKSILIGVANLVFTLIGMTLIDKLGRKTLLLIGAAGTCASLLGVGYVFSTHSHLESVVWLLVSFIAFFAISQGAVIWVYIAEVFPTLVRSKGQSIGSGSHWVMAAIVSGYFPYIVQRFSQSAPFYFFALMCAVQFVTVLFIYPETKGKTLEQLQVQLHR